jgi:COMPASS component BRE2
MNGAVHVNRLGTSSTTLKGWRMARANVGVREGDWYYECKIVRGIPSGGHVRVGWARREAPLDAPVGFDGYSYGIRDMSGQKVHMSRPKDFADVSFEEGDVIGLRICLPPLETQRGLTDDLVVKAGDVIRDRIPIRFKNQLWFEQFEYQSTKDMEELMNPSPGGKPGNPPKTLPDSWIKIYRNGEYLGTPWEDLYAFLPPASRPLAAIGGRELDDGTLGYYPAVSVFRSAIVEVNFGPEWICPLKQGEGEDGDDNEGAMRPLCERYDEQIAEDITYDIVDEIGLLFSEVPDAGDAGTASGGDAAVGGGVGGGVVKEEIKEMVMEDE